ncbi:beta-glucanase (GH16 family) [Algoriphagus iocasae]|uniref:Beta-glucanase (GH16 family) n=1 Tax=Algoriphagus iocasae TaxID=1836499 RepID=A0A841MEM5_9BACT|nr:glycoside hydrolase family 16 protein [Algoriphagus iocasae]MBB6326552.1 beta-glucanase (GH16 family) [Algoriphagus iocasae]
MTSILRFISSAFLLSVFNFSVAQQLPRGYQLVWQEEFEKEGAVSDENWNFEKGFVRNNEMQWYQEANAGQKGGMLFIEGRREKVANPAYEPGSENWKKSREFAEYTSSSINTRGKFEFQYGILEVKAKIDTASGMWPAIWTLGISKPWPANGEIDVMEFYQVKGEPTILANAAWADASKRANWDEAKIPFANFLKKDPEWAEKFHIWKMDWTEDYIRLYLDGELLNEVNLKETINPDGFNPFHQPHYILLNLALGSNGGDLSPTDFPREYVVDYVKVYQKK